MLQFDHMTVIAPSLTEGMDYVGKLLNIPLLNGNIHRDMGTHNRRVRLSESCYLEVVAVNPKAPPPSRPRWFGFERPDKVRADWDRGARLRGWVARTEQMDEVLAAYGSLLGEKTWLDEEFFFSVLPGGELPLDGALPSVIDGAGEPPTASTLTDQEIRLQDFVLEHPEPEKVRALYEKIDIIEPPLVKYGPTLRYTARLETPNGVVNLA